MTLLKGWKLTLLAGMALASANGQVFAQAKPGSLDPRVLGAGGPMMPASYRMPGPPPEAYQPTPTPDYGPSADPNIPSVPYGDYGGPSCGNCGACNECCGQPGCDAFGRSLPGLLHGIRSRCGGLRGSLLPYGEGGVAAQRWFDFSAEAIVLQRTRGASNFVTSSLGAGTNNFVLGTDAVDLDKLRAGLSLQANIQTGPGSNLEVAYFGLNKWSKTASATSAAPNLYSFISNFGTLPAGGFDDPDRSFLHSLTYTSQLNNGEINFRRRWAEPQGFFQGSFLTGVRYVNLDELATFSARGENNNTAANNGPRFFDYGVNTHNSLIGWQFGGDLWYNLIPGVKVGGELKTGVYNNSTQQHTTINANSITDLTEYVSSNKVANVTQLTSTIVYRLNYSFAAKASYQFIYIDNVALATENFNGAAPTLFNPNSVRVPTINNSQDIVLQGFSIGGEYTW